jgi:hypothetical protein
MIGLRGKNFRRVRRWSHQPPGPNNFEQSWQGQWEEQRVRSWFVGIAVRVRIEKRFTCKPFAAKSQIFHVFATKAKLNTSEKIAERLGELEGCVWDIVCFSQARSSWGIANLPHEHNFSL